MNSECEVNCKYIDEVIIIGSPRKKDGGHSLTVGDEDTGGGEWNQPKKCRDFMDCMPFPLYGGRNLPTQPPAQPPTPCEKATNGKNIANNLIKNPTIKQKMDAVLRGKLGANNEWAIAIGQNSDGSYSISNALEGIPIKGDVPEVPSGNYVSDGHTHRGSGGPSGGDFYGMIGIMKDNPHYTTRFVYGTHHGSQELYALVITDRNLAMQFLSQYPRRENYDEEAYIFRRDTNLGKDFHKMYQTINKGYYNYEQHQNNYSTEAIALAYILEKYNTRIALVKQDKNGNFQPFRVKEVPNYPISGSDGKKTTGANVSDCP